MSIDENKTIVLGFLEKITNGKYDEAFAAMSDTGTWWVAGSFPLSGSYTL